MNELDYKQFYDRVGKLIGWDFSKVKCISEGVAWDFYDEVRRSCKSADLLLDIGCGGGEALLKIAEGALLLVGIDNSTGMIEAATSRLDASGIVNVRLLHMDAEKLDFPGSFFNVVSCRQAPFCASEVARVIVPGGIFLTQQVSEADKCNLKQAFGRGQSFGEQDGALQHQYMSELYEAGFRDIQALEYDATEYYHSYEDLVFLLKHTPIVPNFGKSEDDFSILDQFIQENQTNKGIKTNSKRFMLIAKK
ncbi:class I SAM-dependent methyltransferase [Paenibacillus silvisoli]|uniref:class I SAM-dependent methyltransferase n=1 Tax=Paenibacillus silvisoli TaxID=3110539 RepID=UPI00280639FC|nr:class I SAM-dependent methyltransferase [Paenibacillus silvisoli]